jgi:hypothetical protein
MNKRILFASYKSLLALLILVAVITQIINLVGFGVFNLANFFSFFTIESNLFIAVIFALSAWGYWRNRPVKYVTSLRGAAALYMVTTGLVYITLLTGLQESLNTNIPWVNFVLHYFVPAVAFLDWLIDRPAGARLSYKAVLPWLIFPIVWLVYSIVRGAMVGWYAYPFLDPHTGGGLSEVIIVCVGISILMGGLGALLVWFGSFRFHKK